MGRVLRVVVLLGMVFALLPAVPAAAARCGGDFSQRLECWTRKAGGRTVTLTIDGAVPFDGTEQARKQIIETLRKHSDKLVVEVPGGVSTGEGGTVLLLLADEQHRFVEPDARIDQLSRDTLGELDAVCTADRRTLCGLLDGHGQVSGTTLTQASQATKTYFTSSSADPDGNGFAKWLVPGTAAVLALLLAALFLLVRRTRATPAVAAGPAPAARTPDEPTRALRTTRARSVTRTGPTHPAVVRTDLHPQGYVELDRVLYRAVWAEPAQTAPPPGSRVDVADGPDPGVLYAFPPAAGRHAHAR
ncbi:hypothetical protein SAMN06272735_5486 [Streptomyces sp. TLI_55]|uniref:hypothetical protein n=1 Tax=Streptomyces sp. TLI_55 TaxID=1938861 RepID=UPI000BCE1679|nr:hypothetical protein [Streptomyces sp. TLI_55]SNX63675.1 hypothetical protein SAMN06272735_5486 [Streptomyces sp. TLI_55]